MLQFNCHWPYSSAASQDIRASVPAVPVQEVPPSAAGSTADEGPSPKGDEASMTSDDDQVEDYEKVDQDPYHAATDVSSLHQ